MTSIEHVTRPAPAPTDQPDVPATRRPEQAFCRACLTGRYPTAVPEEAAKLRFEPVRA